MHSTMIDTLSDKQDGASARTYRRSILRKRDIRSLRRANHGLSS